MTLEGDLKEYFFMFLGLYSSQDALIINMIFQVYKVCLPVKFCTLMTFQGGLIKFGIFGSILLWNILIINWS